MKRIGVDVPIATDDASRGHHDLVTEVLQQVLDSQPDPHRIVCCGPEVMMEADGGWDYKRTCVEGPVFDAASIQWR